MAQPNGVFVTRRETVGQGRAKDYQAPARPEPPEHLQKIIRDSSLMFYVGLMFWRLRREYPEFAMEFKETEIEAFNQSLAYNEQSPKVAVAATQTSIVLRVADKATGDMIVVNENNVEDLEKTELAKKLRRMHDTVPGLVNAIIGGLNAGTTSDDQIRELCQSALDMARA